MQNRTARLAVLVGGLFCAQPAFAGQSSAINYLPSPVDITPSIAGSWQDVDVSPYVPLGATWVLVDFYNPTITQRDYGIRVNGSTDAALIRQKDQQLGWLMTGLDTGSVFEIYTEDTSVETYLLGYTMEGVTFFTNRIDKSPSSTNIFEDVDISADTGADTAIGAIFTVVVNPGSSEQFALRKKGSTDDRYTTMRAATGNVGLIGVDVNEIAQIKVSASTVDLYLAGYVTEGAVFFTNGIDKSTATVGTYVDVDITADIGSDTANGAIVEWNRPTGRRLVAVRENGVDDDLYLNVSHSFTAVGIDANDIFEQKIEADIMDLYLVGYTLEDTNVVKVLTARSTSGENKLEWVNPSVGPYASTRIVKRTDRCPQGALDPLATPVTDQSAGLGNKDSYADGSLTNGTTHFYGAYVDEGGGVYTTGPCVMGRPFDTTGVVKWGYSTGATSLATPGLRFSAGSAYVDAVSNDRIVHSMEGGALGGSWPAPWKPYVLGGVAQARPPVVGFAVGSAAQGAAFLGAQDGQVYAVNAEDGTLAWNQTVATMLQAAPAGHFFAYDTGALDLILIGTRNGGGGPNSLEALHVNTGLPAWSFTNSSGQGGDNALMGIISGAATVDYGAKRVYFASRAHGSGSPNTLWCLSFDVLNPTLERAWALGDIDGSPVFYNGLLYAGTNAGEVKAVDPSLPLELWSYPASDGPVKGFVFPHFGTSNLVFSTNDNLWSILDTGGSASFNWMTPVAKASTPLQVPFTDKVLAGSDSGKLYQMDVFTGGSVTSVTLGDGTSIVGPPMIDLLNSMIYVGTEEGIIYAVSFPLP